SYEMMISYETIVDAVSAIVVLIFIAAIIAAAWISTNVREQPLIATAVVVFQRQSDGENSEQNSNEEGALQNPVDNNSNTNSSSINTTETNLASASTAPSVRPKEPKTQIKSDSMEDKNKDKESEDKGKGDEFIVKRCTEGKEEEKYENKMEELNNFEKIGNTEKNKDVICFEENSSPNELKNICSTTKKMDDYQEEKEKFPDMCDISGLKNVHSIASSSSASSPIQNDSLINKTNEITPEMEIRNRRLKHFISMGNQEVLENKSETICTSHIELVDNNLNEESTCRKGTDSKEKSDNNILTASESKDYPVNDSGVSECSSLEALTDNDIGEVILNEGEKELPPGSIRIRLKFLDDSQRFVHALPTDLIGHFKRQQFSLEISENRRIRLIFNGQLLSSDSSTLAHYGLFDNCVVHCHVSAPQQPTPEGSNNNVTDLQHDDDDTFMSGLLAPLLYCVLMVMWYLRYQYGHLFNTCSSVILLCLTALLLISTYLLYTTQQQQQQPASTSAPLNNSTTLNTNAVGQITLGAS
ncbi:unnamed protein product, partial [Meganyctiphanes norvegica]